MNALILHPEYESLIKEIEGLKSDIVTIQTRIDHIKTVDDPFYRVEYNRYFGELEQEIVAKYYKYCLLKRKLEMIQAALNRNAEPDMESIEGILDAEAEEYNAILQERAAEIKALSSTTFKTVSPEDAIQAKTLYQKIVRALHPDINPEATSEDCENLQQAVEAFAKGDIATLEAMSAVLELSGKLNAVIPNSLEELRKQREHLTQTALDLANQLKKIKDAFPMNQVPLLLDKTLVNEKIATLKKESEEYDKLLGSYIQRVAPFEKGNNSSNEHLAS